MSRVDDIIAAESEELERAELPDPLPGHVRVERRNEARSKMFSLRLTDDELAELEDVAEREGLPARTLARMWLLDRLRAESEGTGGTVAERLTRLEREVFQRTS